MKRNIIRIRNNKTGNKRFVIKNKSKDPMLYTLSLEEEDKKLAIGRKVSVGGKEGTIEDIEDEENIIINIDGKPYLFKKDEIDEIKESKVIKIFVEDFIFAYKEAFNLRTENSVFIFNKVKNDLSHYLEDKKANKKYIKQCLLLLEENKKNITDFLKK